MITKDGYEFPASFDPPSFGKHLLWGLFLLGLIGGAIAAAKYFSTDVPQAVYEDRR